MILKRVIDSPSGTFGTLIHNGVPICVTLENKWMQNKPNISCIPPGSYQCELTVSPKYGKVFTVLNVPERTHILFHWGNWQENTKGCILVGTSYEVLDGKPGISASKNAFKKLMSVADDKFTLTII